MERNNEKVKKGIWRLLYLAGVLEFVLIFSIHVYVGSLSTMLIAFSAAIIVNIYIVMVFKMKLEKLENE